MSKLIAVWGTPDSGKTTFATKLARSIYEEYQSTVIVVYADNETPTLPVIFPNFKKEDMFSVGAALAKTDVTQEDVVKQLVTVNDKQNFGFLGFTDGENRYTYPSFDLGKVRTVIIALIALAVILAVALPKDKPADPVTPPESTGDDTTVDIPPASDDPVIDIPGDETDAGDETDTPDDPDETEPTEFDPTDPIGNGDIAPDEINDDPAVKTVDSKTEDGDKTPAVVTPPAEDKVKPIEKAPTEVPSDNEAINDNVIAEKEKVKETEEKKIKEDEEKHPTVVVEEKTATEQSEEKAPVIVEEKDDTPTGNGPTYVDPTKGDHPFVPPVAQGGGGNTADDLIGDGDRPGEGIHF